MRSHRKPLLLRLHDERGTSLVELVVATVVLALAAVGLVGSLAVGMRTVGSSRQRSYASSVATKRLEEARDLAFTELGLNGALVPSRSADPIYHEHLSTDDPPLLDVNQDGDFSDGEPLVTDGSIQPIEDPPVDANLTEPTEMEIHNYVTWVDDPRSPAGSRDFKRVTVVVVWKNPLSSAVTNRVTTSTFIGKGTITIPTPTPVPTPVITPGPTPDPGCQVVSPTDLAFDILEVAGAESGFTNSSNLSLQLQAQNASTESPVPVELSTDCATWQSGTTLTSGLPTTLAKSFGSPDGVVVVYARFTEPAGARVRFDSIVLDSVRPTPPGALRQSSCTPGNDRTVTLTWDASSDTNLAGYRLYQSVNAAQFQLVATTSSPSASHSSKSSTESVRYLVRAYDRAGNESLDSNVLTYTRHSCAGI